MFKLVALFALLAVVACEPGAIFSAAPYTYSTPYITPAITSYSHQYNVAHGSPYLYSSTYPGYAHFIKKRSAQLAYNYGIPTTYAAASPYLTSTYHYSSPIASTYLSSAPGFSYAAPAAHFIKKRSAALALATNYIAPASYAAPASYYSANYAAGPIYPSTPYYASPYAYPYFYKK